MINRTRPNLVSFKKSRAFWLYPTPHFPARPPESLEFFLLCFGEWSHGTAFPSMRSNFDESFREHISNRRACSSDPNEDVFGDSAVPGMEKLINGWLRHVKLVKTCGFRDVYEPAIPEVFVPESDRDSLAENSVLPRVRCRPRTPILALKTSPKNRFLWRRVEAAKRRRADRQRRGQA